MNKLTDINIKGIKGALPVLLLVAAFVVTVFCTATGAWSVPGTLLRPGDVADQRYKATRRIENTIATEHNRLEAEKNALNLPPTRVKDEYVGEQVQKKLTDLFANLDDIRAQYRQEQIESTARSIVIPAVPEPVAMVAASLTAANAHAGISVLASDTDKGDEADKVDGSDSIQKSDNPEAAEKIDAATRFESLQLTLTGALGDYLLESEESEYEHLKEATLSVLSAVMDQGIQELDTRSLLNIKDQFDQTGLSTEMREIGYQILSSYVEPNYVVDEEATSSLRKEAAEQYSAVWLLEGQTIVDDGEIVSEEAYELLRSLNLINDSETRDILPIASAAALEALIFALTGIFISMFNPRLAENSKEAALLFTIYVVVVVAFRLLNGIPYQFMPVMVFTMLTAMLIDLRLSVILNIFMTITLICITKGSIETIVFFVSSGFSIALMAKFAMERSHIFIVGILSSAINFVLMLVIAMFFRGHFSMEALLEAGYAAISGIFTVVLCMGSLPFWEAAFGVVTNIKLLDLTNPNNPLLRRLALEAPGTYHHSLLVANLAETAAYNIGTDANLARVGGYYHDIGKLKAPSYFIENQLGSNPHDTIAPKKSAEIIIDHVRYGLELANKNKLPQRICDFIAQHHGNSVINYFYCKAKDSFGGEDVSQDDFRYPFDNPTSKETAIVMLADIVEAAMRTLMKTSKSSDNIEKAIKKLIHGRLEDGSLNDSQLTLSDLEKIAISFGKVLKGMNHDRIAYPAMEEGASDPAAV
ncbi:MAG: HDIG domain-containing protein [Clostridiales bacterium]|jgi:putative nucleotidyltransferase with HDIG domain|nr:HDIG domain-containing protein [Clostridiales bacterium]